jgi:O-antigen/teichoic acid export membrane protein
MPPADTKSRTGHILGSAAQISARIASLLLGLALMAFLTRNLGVADYGLYAISVVMVSWLGVSLIVATTGTTVRIVAGEEHGHRYAATMLRLVAVAGLVLSVALFLSAGWLAAALRAPSVAPLLRILSPDLVLAAVAATYSGILIGQERFFSSAAMVLLGAACQLAAAWLLVVGGWGPAGACAAVAVGSALQVFTGWRLTGIGLMHHERVPFQHLWGHVRLMALGQLALRVSQSMDLLAVKFLLRSPVAAGHYAGAQNITFAAMSLFVPVSSVALQSLASGRRTGDFAEAQHLAAKFVRGALAYAGLLCGLSVATPRITTFLLGPEFAPSSPVLALLLWAVAFRVLAVAGRVLISAVNEATSVVAPLLVLIAAGLVAYAFAIPRAGITGAAMVALGLALAASITSLREGLRLIGITFPWISAVRIVAGAAAAALVTALVPGDGPLVLVALAAACLTFALTLILLGEWPSPRSILADFGKARPQ